MHAMDEQRPDRVEASIGAAAFTGPSRPARTFPKDRVCHHEGCETRLSIYNDGKFCCLHGQGRAPRLRGRKIA